MSLYSTVLSLVSYTPQKSDHQAGPKSLGVPKSHATLSYETGQSSLVITLSHYPAADVTCCWQNQPKSHQASVPIPNLMGSSV